MNTDGHFLIGKQHMSSGLPCQDYSLSGNISDNIAYAIVSDGCSSGQRTDVGARVVSLATEKALRSISFKGFTPQVISHYQQAGIESSKDLFGLCVQDMLATCLYALVSPEGAMVHIQGDGVVAYKMRNGDIQIYMYDWAENTPCYPAYAHDGYASFICHHGNDMSQEKATCKTLHINSKGETIFEATENISLGEGVQGFSQNILPEKLVDISCIAVFSDGVEQVENTSCAQVVASLLDFKNTQGVFATRRLNRCIKDWQKQNISPLDDISYAVIHIP
ncbi:protein phosphatase 2C domain-containing protein [Candidatus Gracilibacteria bacterium]|nr:protein phosphatase 2C domain-containing protein [Candidatus Gracilibacteria bacterium]